MLYDSCEGKIMKPQDLVQIFEAPDLSILTPKQMSFRLPIIVAAKISALNRLYPNKTKTEIVGYLLASALDQLEEAMPSEKGELIEDSELAPGKIYLDVGTKGIFRSYTEDALREIEAEIGLKEPIKLNSGIIIEPWENDI